MWLDVEHLRLPAGLLRSPALVGLGGCHGRCLWLRRSVRSGRVSPDSRWPHAGPIPMHRTKTPPPPSAARTDAHGRELPVALGQASNSIKEAVPYSRRRSDYLGASRPQSNWYCQRSAFAQQPSHDRETLQSRERRRSKQGICENYSGQEER